MSARTLPAPPTKETLKPRKLRYNHTVVCKFCEKRLDRDLCRKHDGGYVCPNCWDDRLKITE